jgi:carbamate kinase
MLVVVALGGNALLRRGEPLEAEVQRHNAAAAAESLAPLAADHQIVVTHGNGPQVGLLALQAAAYAAVPPYPLDVLGAESEGMIGYLLEQELENRLPDAEVCTLLTQVEVDPDDPAFREPSKPIGPVYHEATAQALADQRGWAVAPDGEGYRRVVPSPKPKRVIELSTIRLLVRAGVLVICAGGGGIPVVVDAGGAVHGVEAVVDKDHAAALLAGSLGAEALLLLSDVDAVHTGWRTADDRPVREATPDQLRAYDFAPGSMGPKVEAVCAFVEATGGTAAIGDLGDATALLDGAAGTRVRPGTGVIEWYPGGATD